MKKQKILNVCMVLTIVLVVLCGIMAVGSVKGWFEKETEFQMTVSEAKGIAMIERSGIAYEVDTGTAVRVQDRLYTKAAAALAVSEGDTARVCLNGNAELLIRELEAAFAFEVLQGEAFVDSRNQENVIVYSDQTKISLDQAVATISTQAGATMVYVYSGQAEATAEETEETVRVEAGQVLSVINNWQDSEVSPIQTGSLSDFQMTRLMVCGMDQNFCFSESDLKRVQEEREAEILRAQQELLAFLEAERQEAVDNSSSEAEEGSEEDLEMEFDEEEIYTGSSSETEESDDSEETQPVVTAKYCTIEIRCDTILSNMENLEPGKEGYVPANGTILGTCQVEFAEGETVFEVLQRACSRTGIQLEYSYTPIYESYYIEGINHLYEFDCGDQSGWMYKVNGWFPNYGCSSYTLQEGDVIVWCYTCNGQGADVGGSVY